MVSTIRYSANASSDHHPNQVPGILIIMNPKQPNLPTCSVTSTYLLFHVLSNPSLHLIANTTLGIIMTAIKISPITLNHSIYSIHALSTSITPVSRRTSAEQVRSPFGVKRASHVKPKRRTLAKQVSFFLVTHRRLELRTPCLKGRCSAS